MFNFLQAYHPQPILMKIGPFEVHWYGFLMVIGGLVGLVVILSLVKRFDIEKGDVGALRATPLRPLFHDLLLYFVIGAVIGARVYYVLYAWEMYRGNWFDVLKIWQGGLAIHGIMLGGFAATYLFCRIKKQSFWFIADFAVVGLAAAQAVGRAGNYFNQEIFGKPTSLPWGVPIDAVNRPAAFAAAEYFHPVFLYECLGNLAIAVILFLIMRWRLKEGDRQTGNVFLLYLVLYSAQRFLLEFLRVDYSPLISGIRWAQAVSVALVIFALGLLLYRRRRKNVGLSAI
ncbi:prolipoprotein diacylglyceryl transferase [Candidatus Falkowbacteria bacterium RIFOXYC2_FULL_48_21]|uniref:Phosphatidylglycerol--prolipoprotein diacylglyceryl transferase n=1 Tax=Candidatus Falkowbacteria bacterium RIFOXYC2_FULL_48_21 TaxID=1798005 RepID=A0A1F5T5V0_9BACT|nr:MAG: prolipoprotein diacylglyceryl transferase [Candidatus Falkowbacteria bacterium RIFOXYC2_FULL_48_21]